MNDLSIRIVAASSGYAVMVDNIEAYVTPFQVDARRYAARVAQEWDRLITQPGTVTA